MTDKAKSYVPQIRETWTELGKANANKVQCEIKLGELLHGAKEALGKKGDWMEFRAQHFHEISHRTANVYMYLATTKPSSTIRAIRSVLRISWPTRS